MATTVKCRCATCGDLELPPDRFTLVYHRDVAEPWMVNRCPHCDEPHVYYLTEWDPKIVADLTKIINRKLILDDHDTAYGPVEVDSIIDVDVAWQALSALHRHQQT